MTVNAAAERMNARIMAVRVRLEELVAAGVEVDSLTTTLEALSLVERSVPLIIAEAWEQERSASADSARRSEDVIMAAQRLHAVINRGGLASGLLIPAEQRLQDRFVSRLRHAPEVRELGLLLSLWRHPGEPHIGRRCCVGAARQRPDGALRFAVERGTWNGPPPKPLGWRARLKRYLTE